VSVRSARYNLLSLRNPKGLTVIPEERDAWAFLDAAGIKSSREQRAVIDLVRGLKHAQLWSKMKAIYPFVGGTATTHKFNLKDPRDADAAFRLIFSGGWTHSSTGATPNGTNAYAETNMAANTFASSNVHQSFYSRTNANGLHFDLGASNTGSNQIISLYTRYIGNILADIGNYLTSRITVATGDSLGYYVQSRTSSTLFKLYKNNVNVGTSTANDTANLPSEKFAIAGVFISGTWIQLSIRQCAFVTIGDGLTDTDATALYNIVQRFQTSLGRQV
jgi:hypothetical protein